MIACRMGMPLTEILATKIKPCVDSEPFWRNMASWNRGMELLRLKSMTPEVQESHERLRNGYTDFDTEHFEVTTTKAARTLGMTAMYRIMGMYIYTNFA